MREPTADPRGRNEEIAHPRRFTGRLWPLLWFAIASTSWFSLFAAVWLQLLDVARFEFTLGATIFLVITTLVSTGFLSSEGRRHERDQDSS